MPWTTNPYATLTQVKTALDLQGTDQDTFLTELLGEAQDLLDEKIGYPHQTNGTTLAPVTNVYSGKNSCQLWIDDCIQITQVLEVTYNVVLGTIASVTSQSVDITADVILGPDNTSPGYILSRHSEMPFLLGRQNYHVSGVWGEPAIPARLTRACERLVTHWYGQKQTSYADTIAENQGVRLRYNKEIPKDVMEIIRTFTRTLFLAR